MAVAEVIGFVDESLALAVGGPTPDVVHSGSYDFKAGAVGADAGDEGAIERCFISISGGDGAEANATLGEIDPTTGGAGELVDGGVRVLNAESTGEDFAAVGFTIAIGVFEGNEIGSMNREDFAIMW